MSSQRLERTYKGQGERSASGLLPCWNGFPDSDFQQHKGSLISAPIKKQVRRCLICRRATAPFSLLKVATPKHFPHVIFIGTLVYKDSNQLLLQSVGQQMSLLLGSIRACSCSSSSSCLIQCTIICFQFSRALGRSSFHHLPIFPAWNRRLATTLLASVL